MLFTELKKLHWLLSNGHFSVISERALVSITIGREQQQQLEILVRPVGLENQLCISFIIDAPYLSSTILLKLI